MNLNLDDLVYKLRIDGSELDDGARTASQAMGQLNAPAVQAGRTMGALARDTKLTRQEMMALNYTVSDTVSSLASGMSPLTILLQQGPQVRDAFGGIGNAIRGIASVITPAAVGFTALAVAAGSVATAFIQGYRQSDELEKAINRTGNAAGVTAGQFEEMVTKVAAAGSTSEGSARQILLGLVRTGQIGPQSLQAAATAAASMAKAYGMTEEEVVKSFQGMQKSASDWAAEQNKTMNFLTLEQYRYIRSLEEQGKQTEAQLELFKRVGQASDRVTENLGALELAWKAISREASGAWQSMLGFGRTQTVDERLSELEALRERMLQPGGGYGGSDSPAMQAEVVRLDEQISQLRQRIANERKQAADTGARAAAERKAIDEEREREKERNRRASGRAAAPEIPYAITDPLADQRQAFLRSEIAGRGATDKALADRDAAALEARRRALEALTSQTTIARTERLREQLALLNEEFQAQGGEDSGSKLGQAIVQVEQQLRDMEPVAKQSFEQMSVFADQASRNIQDGLGETLQMAMAGNFKNIGDLWVQLLQRMVAQAAAARLNEALFGADGKSGPLGTIFAEAFKGIFGPAQARAGVYAPAYSGGAGPTGGISIPSSLRGGAATGANALERDMITLVHKGEAIVPKAYNPAAGGPRVTINNFAGAEVQTRQRDDGGLNIDVLSRVVEQRIAGNVAGGRGPMAGALRSRGLNSSSSLARMG